jgi:hypothetical protein
MGHSAVAVLHEEARVDEDTQAGLSPGEKLKVNALQMRLRRFKNWSIHFVASTAVILVVAFAFEHLASEESVDKAVGLQRTLDDAISAFDPNQIFSYLVDAWIYVVGVVINALLSTLTLALSPSAATSILTVAKIAIYPLCGAFVIALLPVVIVIEMMHGGHFLEGVLAIGCWLGVFLLARLNAIKWSGRDRGFSFPFIEIIAVTFAFLWFIKFLMMGADVLLGWYIKLAGICVFGSTVSSWAYWCVSKRTEHTVSETAVHSAKNLVSHGVLD